MPFWWILQNTQSWFVKGIFFIIFLTILQPFLSKSIVPFVSRLNVFFFADLSIPVIESTVCPPHYVENNGRCYRFFQDIPLDWESADHFCTLDNGTLASISTIYRFGFIQALGRHVNLTTYWIGLRRSNVWKMCELWYIFVTRFHVEHYNNAHEFIDSIELY